MLDTELIASGPRRVRRSFSSGTMKHTFLALMFAAAPLLAQGVENQRSEKARTELAKAIAIEEQERDLAKAEKAYRDAIDDKALSDAVRRLAKQRLGALLKKLGRDAEAEQFLGSDKGTVATLDDVTDEGVRQDIERTKALREKARELVQKVLAQKTIVGRGIADGQLRDQMVWIGEPAIPEIAAALAQQQHLQGPFNYTEDATDNAIAGLAGLLWYFGGPAAESHLETLLQGAGAALRSRLVVYAVELREPRMLKLAERWLRREEDHDVAMLLLSNFANDPLSRRLDPEVMLDDAARRPVNVQVYVLGVVGARDDVSRAALAKAHALARTFLAGSDPEVGRAAQRFLATRVSQTSPDGVALLLEQLPHMQTMSVDDSGVLPAEWLLPADPNRGQPVRKEVAERIWPSLVACANRFPTSVPNWLRIRLHRFANVLDAAIVPDLLSLIERGNYSLVGELGGKVNTANAAAVFALFDQLPLDRASPANPGSLLEVLGGAAELPADLFAPLRDRAAARLAVEPKDDLDRFAMPIAKTGNPEAAAWLAAGWQRTERNPRFSFWAAMVELGRRNRGESVRAPMREMAQQVGGEVQARLLLALLAMGDEPALQLVPRNQSGTAHPYATSKLPAQERRITPLQYLLHDNPDPPHGFSVAQRIAMLRSWQQPPTVGDISPWSAAPIADDMVLALAEVVFGEMSQGDGQGRSWQFVALQRLRKRGDDQALAAWVERALTSGGSFASAVLEVLRTPEITRWSTRIEAMLTDENLGTAAANALLRAERPLDVARMLAPGHPLRYWTLQKITDNAIAADDAVLVPFLRDPSSGWRVIAATELGERASVAAVPDLIPLLKDPDSDVRAAVMNALTKIRAHHEQQAYWDRIVKGLDASPASAAEKLLLQAKPGAPKQQRLLAITSLGTLGAPEALPFLIEWTQDPDADVAKKANEAVTQIHLNPRK